MARNDEDNLRSTGTNARLALAVLLTILVVAVVEEVLLTLLFVAALSVLTGAILLASVTILLAVVFCVQSWRQRRRHHRA